MKILKTKNNLSQILTAVLLLLPLTAAADLFKADEFTLDNGLRVVVVENHKAPLIKHMVWYNAGAVDEVKGKGGSAHLLEHLMFRGTKKVKGDFIPFILNYLKSIFDKISEPVGCGLKSTISALPANNGVE